MKVLLGNFRTKIDRSASHPRCLFATFFAFMAITSPAGSQAVPSSARLAGAVARPSARIAVETENTSDESVPRRTVTLTFVAGIRPETVRAVLNGKDVSAQFSTAQCDRGSCFAATLREENGVRSGKNVLYAVARKEDGSLVSSRVRFAGTSLPSARFSSSSAFKSQKSAEAVKDQSPALPTASGFLPPSVAFNTLSQGGYNDATPWIQIGSQLIYPGPNVCPAGYLVIVLDRQDLMQKTSPPESSPQCFSTGNAMAAYLKTLTAQDLVIAGTVVDGNADAQLDTSAIGGTDYTNNYGSPNSPNFPSGYMIVGAGGAAPGSAFENYNTPNTQAVPQFATGTLNEDVNGNYNFQPSDAVEYIVSPNDPGYPGQSMVRIGIPPNNPDNSEGGVTTAIYTSPTSTGGVGGYWLLTLERSDLSNQGCRSSGISGNVVTFPNCGQFFPTGDSNSKNATIAYQNLDAALRKNTKPDQLVFLTTVGTAAGSSDPFAVAGTAYTDNGGTVQVAYAGHFADGLRQFGGTPEVTLSLGNPGSAYTLVSCYPDCGNSLNGNAALSTSLEPQDGQTGYIHGILQRSLRGLFWPAKASQETQANDAAGGGPDYTLDIVGAQQPVDWPELVTLLPGASTVNGQIAAYHYMSYQLITNYYIIGAQGSYLDDLHYYFTGSNNTFIDYHTFNPANLPFPGSSGQCYAWTDPVTGNPLPCFTQGDFSAVALQIKAEVVDLVNVLQYMVNGSTNLKDVVAAGNGSAALALIGAAAEVEASTLQPPPAAQVPLNVSNVLNLVTNVVGVATAVATDGLSQDVSDAVNKIGSTIGAAFGTASAATAGNLTTTGSPAPLPSPNYPLLTTIGDLASGSLQQQLTIGFDTQLDSILGDWNKLSQIGPKITDSSNVAFYSPNQVAQNLAVKLLGQGAQRSFYLALVPTRYYVHFYPLWFGLTGKTNFPDMGDAYDDGNKCNTWYSYNPIPANIVISDPTYNLEYAGFSWGELASDDGLYPGRGIFLDWYLIAGDVQNKGKNNQHIPLMDSQLANTLFTASGLNLPVDAFVTSTGPMANRWLSATDSPYFYGFNPQNLCAGFYYNDGLEHTRGNQPENTVTTLTVASSGLVGESLPLQAKVASAGAVPTGSVSFQDGDAVLGSTRLDSKGNATFSATGLALGFHSIVAYYVVPDGGLYYPSQSDPSALTVYANSPDLAMTMSSNSAQVSYGKQSSAISVHVSSLFGLAGTVTFTCSGLPVGMSCNFTPAQGSISADGTLTTSFVIAGMPAQFAQTQTSPETRISGFASVALLPLSLISFWIVGRAGRGAKHFLCLLLLSGLGWMLGCSGSNSGPAQETGIKTVLVTATSGLVSKSVPLTVSIQ